MKSLLSAELRLKEKKRFQIYLYSILFKRERETKILFSYQIYGENDFHFLRRYLRIHSCVLNVAFEIPILQVISLLDV
jgi:hypothetical protein